VKVKWLTALKCDPDHKHRSFEEHRRCVVSTK
jgi:hypothetical protein